MGQYGVTMKNRDLETSVSYKKDNPLLKLTL